MCVPKTYDMAKAIEIVQEHVPEEHPSKKLLMDRLEWCLRDISYRPPETQSLSWQYFENALIDYVGVDMSTTWLSNMANTLKKDVWFI